jgi:hypothetical protein
MRDLTLESTGIEKSGELFRSKIVGLIMAGHAEQALKLLSDYYRVEEPDLRVGTVKRHRNVAGCYVHGEKRIYLSKGEYITNPFLILHEFYHHLRASQVRGREQIDKRADLFALNFIRAFVLRSGSNGSGNP